MKNHRLEILGPYFSAEITWTTDKRCLKDCVICGGSLAEEHTIPNGYTTILVYDCDDCHTTHRLRKYLHGVTQHAYVWREVMPPKGTWIIYRHEQP